MNNDAALCPLGVEMCNSWLIYTSDKTINENVIDLFDL